MGRRHCSASRVSPVEACPKGMNSDTDISEAITDNLAPVGDASDSGTRSAPITYAAFGDGPVVLTGGASKQPVENGVGEAIGGVAFSERRHSLPVAYGLRIAFDQDPNRIRDCRGIGRVDRQPQAMGSGQLPE